MQPQVIQQPTVIQPQPQIQQVVQQVINPVNANHMVRNVNTVNTNFPNINPAHTYIPRPRYPTQPIAQPSSQEERGYQSQSGKFDFTYQFYNNKRCGTNTIEC